jgi:membrane-bound lytic murein transglycosylase D
MILKYPILALATLFFITASDPHFGTELTWERLPKAESDDVRELPWMAQDNFRRYILDEDDLVDDRFEVSPFFYASVNFWFMIYTQFESSYVVIHDRENLSLIYKVLDFSSLHAKGLSKNVLYVLQNKLSDEKLSEFKEDLKYLSHNPFSLSSRAKNIYRILTNAGLTIPIKKSARTAFFSQLRNRIRTQTGQKDFIRQGIVRSLPYKTFVKKYFSAKKLPEELLAIPFLESSFNPRAESKVGALGPWQFMPLIGSYYLPKKNHLFDYRSNVGLSSVAAGHLMSENIYLMRSWDLAVTAYNSGTKHLMKTRRELASSKKKINLEAVIKHSDSAHFGFASKNFYSEFLALTRTLAYEEDLFEQIHKEDREDVNDMLRFYLLKCSLRLDKSLSSSQLDDLLFHSHHIRDSKINYARGTIVTTKGKLPSAKFYEISFDTLVNIRPKEWMNLLKNQSCSTR